jgi:hypothetical protein
VRLARVTRLRLGHAVGNNAGRPTAASRLDALQHSFIKRHWTAPVPHANQRKTQDIPNTQDLPDTQDIPNTTG